MIENKIIEISKENTFDRDWAIFTNVEENFKSHVNAQSIQDIVNKITFAKEIDILFANDVFHKRLYEEILWAFNQGGLTINLKYKNDDILSQFKCLKFNKLEKDSNLSLKYIYIKGERNGTKYESAYLLEDDIIKLDSPINFEKEDKDTYKFLKKYQTIFIIDEKYNSKYNELIEKSKEKHINIVYIIEVQNFSKKMHDEFKDLGIDLMVCDKVSPAVLLSNNENRLYCLKYYNNKQIIFETSCLNYFVKGNLYLNSRKSIGIKELPREFLCFTGDKVEKCCIQEEMEVPIEVQCLTMDDFINGNFDKSIINKHNDYSMKCKVVKYKFILNSPKFNSEYRISSVYDDINKVAKNIEELDSDALQSFKDDVKNLESGTWIEKTINNLLKIKLNVLNVINNYQYTGFDKYCEESIDFLEKNKSKMFDKIFNIYKSFNKGAEVIKYSKFDEEIDGYRKTIKDKEKLIQDNIEVLSNKKRIEILSKKIEDLELLKQQFESKENSRDITVKASFCTNYNNWLNKRQTDFLHFDSVTGVVKKESSQSGKFENLLEKYLYTFNDYYDKFLNYLKKVDNCLLFPLDYTVYEKDKKNYIIIDSIDEFYNTAKLCEKYNILTIAKE